MKHYYRKEIDGLRAIAVMSILFFHAGFTTFSGGYVGVDVFFVISGYLITTLIFNSHAQDTFSFKDFYLRRARRILPALFLVLLISLPFAWQWLLPRDMIEFAQSLISTILFASNFFFWSESGYFSTSSELRPLLHIWSLSLEEQFYLLFPLVVIYSLYRNKVFFLKLCILLFVISLFLAVWSSTKHSSFGFFLLPSRIWEFIIGSFVAYYLFFLKKPFLINTVFKNIIGFLGLISILFSIFLFKTDIPFPSYWAIIPTVGTAIVIAFADKNTFTGKLLGNRIFIFIGLISYSTYLWHQPIFAFARLRQLDPLSTNLSLGLIFLSFLLGFITWRYFEPIWRKDKKDKYHTFFIFISLASFICIFFSIAILYSGRTMGRLNHLPKDYFQTSWINLKSEGIDGQKCFSAEMVPCILSKFPNSSKEILLVGDSHASDYGVVFQKYLEKNSFSGSMFTVPGCAFLPSQFSTKNNCYKDYEKLIKLIHSRKFNEIFIIGNYIDHTNRLSSINRNTDITFFKKFIHEILSTDTKVIFLEPRMSLLYDPKKTGALQLNYKNRPVSFDENNIKSWQTAFESLSLQPNFRIFSQDQVLLNTSCGTKECFDGHNTSGYLLFRDINHLTDLGASTIFNAYSEQFKQ